MLRYFIDRPVFASVISILVVLAGMAAGRMLPVTQYPDILPPQVVVTASYSGASAENVADTVAAPLEATIDGVDGMVYMRSISSDDGSMELVITFEVGTDPDLAAINVSNEIQGAMGRLPETVANAGIEIEKRSPAMLQMVTFSSSDGSLDARFISDYVWRNVYTELRRAPGIGDQTFFGAQIYSMRIWLRPDQMAEYDITAGDIRDAIRDQNTQYAAGTFGAEPSRAELEFTYSVTTPGRLSEVQEFENIILRSTEDGSALRLSDVARVELGAHSYSFRGKHNGSETVPVGLYLLPGANALETARGVRQILEELEPEFPDSLEYAVPFDTTTFIDAALSRVLLTLIQALILVVGVVYLFLQTIRGTLIPAIAVPVSLIGTLAGMYLFGFSVNMLTLFGLVLAIGIVVDNAIIVLENTERIMRDEGLPPRDAAIKTMDEVAAPVIAMTLVTVAVFVPVAFIGGFSGQMYQQFAITIAVSVAISGLVALTLSPAMCARLLSAERRRPAWPFRWFNKAFDKFTDVYVGGVRLLLNHSVVGVLLFVVLVGAIVGLFRIVPGGFVPDEDQGYVFAAVELPAASSLRRTEEVMDRLGDVAGDYDEIADVVAFSGLDLLSDGMKSYTGAAYITLDHWSERRGAGQSSDAIVQRLERDGRRIGDANVTVFNPPPITGISTTGGFEAYLQSRHGDSVEDVLAKTNEFISAARERPELAGVRTLLTTQVPRFEVDVDRERAWAMGVPIGNVFDAMQSTFGTLYVNDFNMAGRVLRVHMQSEPEFRERPADLDRVFVRSDNGSLIPLSTLISVERTQGADMVERFNVYPAARIIGEPAEGYSTGQAIAAMEQVASEVLSNDYLMSWTGAAYQEQQAGGASALAFVLGLVFVLLILAAQYERWSLPLAVVTAVPFAIFGALLALLLTGQKNDIYFQIGLLVLISLAAKNAILIVEFAMLKRKEGLSPMDAAMESARLRMRPIMMTAISFILGSVPLALASGAGANSQQAIGIGIIGGMLSATFLAVLFVPMFYYLITVGTERLQGWFRREPATAGGDNA
ncbi:multidrug efflux pump [Natronocella acetinitrilica]|uniref:Efflux pump membrane transporter n=1 Tax=Natronocella acetinitrilica TaxID=414046 RepID=A0AAE3G6A9_9GAMM|nr:multidrug efflux RND transporter permease subunit [Natronocella acetinitrilica]MCP1675551.1 multidrug efflux pump [Natronocella acetinitrilica]